jgi:hypothetical protein
MAIRHRNYGRKPERPTTPRQATGQTFLILVEGEATELVYLEEVRRRLDRKAAAVVVFHGDHTDPVGIVREAIKLRDEKAARAARSAATEAYDQTWVVFDRETQNHPRREQVPEAIKLARANLVRVALSIPSFEFWLLLHYEYTTKAFDGYDACKKALKRFIRDYEKSNLPLVELMDLLSTAIKHAAQCHQHWRAAGGDRNPSTHVDELLLELNDSARAQVRLFEAR